MRESISPVPNRVYTAWIGEADDNEEHRLVEGEGPPRYANGDIDQTCQTFCFRIEAGSWDEAMAIYYQRKGWGVYEPMEQGMSEFVKINKQVPTVEQYMVSFNVGRQQAEYYRMQALRETVYQNDVYEVSVSQVHISREFPACIHLTIERLDKQPTRSWSDMQAIKNELVGPEHEAIEVFPAESRLVDMANQYHLWVFAQEGVTVPIGWQSRQVRSEVFPEN